MNEESKKPEPMSSQKRTALLRYMAVLFAVAFLLVLLSYLIQVFNSQNTITQLTATSASALQNAEGLQTANRELTEENKRLNQELNNAHAAILEYQESVGANRIGALEEGRQNGEAQTQQAYDLLLAGIAAKQAQDKEALEAALRALEPLKGSLTEAALKQYQVLQVSTIGSNTTD